MEPLSWSTVHPIMICEQRPWPLSVDSCLKRPYLPPLPPPPLDTWGFKWNLLATNWAGTLAVNLCFVSRSVPAFLMIIWFEMLEGQILLLQTKLVLHWNEWRLSFSDATDKNKFLKSICWFWSGSPTSSPHAQTLSSGVLRQECLWSLCPPSYPCTERLAQGQDWLGTWSCIFHF